MAETNPLFRPLILAVILTGLLCRLAFAVFTPTFYAPDEQAQFNYIQYLSEHQAFPVLTVISDKAAGESEYHQPPLYYLAMVLLLRLGQAVFRNLTGTVVFLRAFSILLWMLNLWFGGILLKRLQIKGRFVWVFVMAFASLLPTYTFVSSTINNDNLLAALGGGLLCLMAGREQSLRRSLSLGLLLGLALLTKQSAVVFIPAIVLLSVLDCFRHRIRWSSGLWHLGLTLGVALLVYLPWMFRNLHVYGTFTPERLSFNPEIMAAARKVWPSTAYGIASAVHNLVKTFWAVSGISNNVGYPFPLPGMLLLLLFFIMPLVRTERKFDPLVAEANRPVMTAFLFAVLVNILLTLWFGFLIGMGQGRHLFPVLFPIALLLAGRLRRIPAKNPELLAAGFWMVYAVSFTACSLVRFP
jgi:4-amino-4-deoxy-L-arabinose transferase-like glycosyltransferase